MKRTLTSIAIMLTMTGMAQVFRRPAHLQKDQGTYGVTAVFGLDTSSYLYMVDTISVNGDVQKALDSLRSAKPIVQDELISKCEGLLEMNATFEKHSNGDNKWDIIPWQRPRFPLIEDGINKDAINAFWLDKPVRFAPYNNCVGCFHRSPPFLKYMFDEHPGKMGWFSEQERPKKGTWRSDMTYKQIGKAFSQLRLHADDFSECDSGFCGI